MSPDVHKGLRIGLLIFLGSNDVDMLRGGAELLQEPPFWQANTNLPAKGGGEACRDLSKP